MMCSKNHCCYVVLGSVESITLCNFASVSLSASKSTVRYCVVCKTNILFVA